ncbi:MAG TPA: hypothetical protein PLZ84_03405 [Clostridia bacterium]|nr:hypothetical protein [Clostridia bacterium]
MKEGYGKPVNNKQPWIYNDYSLDALVGDGLTVTTQRRGGDPAHILILLDDLDKGMDVIAARDKYERGIREAD